MKKIIALFSLLLSGVASTGSSLQQECAPGASLAPNSLIAALWTLFGIFIGAAGSHWLSLSRDRRKEFNEVSDPIRVALKNEKQATYIHYSNLDSDGISKLADMIGGKAGADLTAAVDRYREARTQWVVRDEFGQAGYSQTAHIEQAIDDILKHLKRR